MQIALESLNDEGKVIPFPLAAIDIVPIGVKISHSQDSSKQSYKYNHPGAALLLDEDVFVREVTIIYFKGTRVALACRCSFSLDLNLAKNLVRGNRGVLVEPGLSKTVFFNGS